MKCQLCHQELILDEEQFKRSGDKEWICPVRIIRNPDDKNKRSDVSHFRITRDDRQNHRIMFPRMLSGINYRVIENKINSTFHICTYTNKAKDNSFGSYDYIMTVPVFEFKDEEHLIKKIKGLIVFS